MSSSNISPVPNGLPLLANCASLDAVVDAAIADAVESGYRACRRHLIRAALCAVNIKDFLPGPNEHPLAELKHRATLATNLILDRRIFIRQPNHDFGRSAGFDAALHDAAKLAADIGATCVCPSHLLAALMNNPATDEDGIDPSYWGWSGELLEPAANCD